MDFNSKKRKKELINLIKKNPSNKDIIKSNIYFPIILKYIDNNIFNDINFCKELLHRNGMALEYMPENIKNDKNLVIIAVFNNGYSLQFASDELRADYDVVSKAILKYKQPLKYASENLQIVFRDKWNNYYAEHHENEWTGYEISYNGIFTSKEKMEEIYEMQKGKNSKKNKNLDSEQEEISDDEQIIIDDFNFEENDIDENN